MPISRTDRVLRAFQQEYEATCVQTPVQLRLSQLPKADQDEYWKRDQELHPSSFPFCGLREAYERFLREDDPVIRQDFGSDYYLNAGTVTHSAFQRWFGRRGKLIGKWECQVCGNVREFGPKPASCKCGSTEMIYHELGAKEGRLSWHTDGIFKYGDEYWVVDLKTSSMFAIQKALDLRKQGKKSDLPYVKNVFQIETYTVLIERKYNIKITGWILAYVPRDKPNQSYWIYTTGKVLTDDRRGELWERIKRAVADHAVSLGVVERPIQVFKRLIPTKLCADKDFYKEFVESPFDSCPLAEAKVCFNHNRLITHIKGTIEG